jgi:hypothetical protein
MAQPNYYLLKDIFYNDKNKQKLILKENGTLKSTPTRKIKLALSVKTCTN